MSRATGGLVTTSGLVAGAATGLVTGVAGAATGLVTGAAGGIVAFFSRISFKPKPFWHTSLWLKKAGLPVLRGAGGRPSRASLVWGTRGAALPSLPCGALARAAHERIHAEPSKPVHADSPSPRARCRPRLLRPNLRRPKLPA